MTEAFHVYRMISDLEMLDNPKIKRMLEEAMYADAGKKLLDVLTPLQRYTITFTPIEPATPYHGTPTIHLGVAYSPCED